MGTVVRGNIFYTLDLKADREVIDFMFSGSSFHKDTDEGTTELENNSVRLAITSILDEFRSGIIRFDYQFVMDKIQLDS